MKLKHMEFAARQCAALAMMMGGALIQWGLGASLAAMGVWLALLLNSAKTELHL